MLTAEIRYTLRHELAKKIAWYIDGRRTVGGCGLSNNAEEEISTLRACRYKWLDSQIICAIHKVILVIETIMMRRSRSGRMRRLTKEIDAAAQTLWAH